MKWWVKDDLVTGTEPNDPEKLREALEFMRQLSGTTTDEPLPRTPASTVAMMEQQRADEIEYAKQRTWPGAHFESAGFFTKKGETVIWSNLHDSSCVGRVCLNPQHQGPRMNEPVIDIASKSATPIRMIEGKKE